MSGLCELQILLCSFMIVAVTVSDKGLISAVSSDAQSAGSLHDKQLVVELDLPLKFTLVSHQQSRKAEED